MAAAASRQHRRTAKDVLWFVPNLIGYSRVAFALVAFGMMMLMTLPLDNNTMQKDDWQSALGSTWFWAVVLYLLSFVGDLFDGWAARKLGQTSTFGGVLDMVTDRCATLGLLMILTAAYSNSSSAKWLPLCFVLLAILDIASHWCQMYASLFCGPQGGAHHKSDEGNAERNILVQWFYRYYWFFGYLCVGAELTYVLLYVRLFLVSNVLLDGVLWAALPGCAAKQVVNVAQLLSACHAIAAQDATLYNNNNKQK